MSNTKGRVTGGSLAGGNPKRGRVDNDYYATNPRDTENFLRQLEIDGISLTGMSFLEPCAGAGHITDVIAKEIAGSTIKSTDIDPRRPDIDRKDFLSGEFQSYDVVFTNPPFTLGREIVTKSLEISNKYVMMFLKLQFLEGVSRKEWLKQTPLKYVYVYSYRASPMRNGEATDENGKKWASTMAFAWFVWENGYTGEPSVRWI